MLKASVVVVATLLIAASAGTDASAGAQEKRCVASSKEGIKSQIAKAGTKEPELTIMTTMYLSASEKNCGRIAEATGKMPKTEAECLKKGAGSIDGAGDFKHKVQFCEWK